MGFAIKQKKLKDFKEKIQEKVDIGTLQEVSHEELQELLKIEHNFTYLGVPVILTRKQMMLLELKLPVTINSLVFYGIYKMTPSLLTVTSV